MEIVQNLWQVGGGDLTAPEDAAIYPIIFIDIRKIIYEFEGILINRECISGSPKIRNAGKMALGNVGH
jgi:hypothetical protein